MKGLIITLLPFLLSILLLAGCDQRQDDQTTANGIATTDNESGMQPDLETAPQVTTAQDVPGSEDAAEVTSRSLMDNASANRELTTFTSLLRSANLVGNLSGTGPYTVFAPAETAFKALPGSTLEDLMKPENQQRLSQILSNHIIAGKLTTNDLQDGAILKTAAGQQLKVSKRDGQVRINGALIEAPDGMSSNGVLHTINKVLMPAEGI